MKSKRARLLWAFAVGFVLITCFWGLGNIGFCGRDDGRYAEIAREMVESGDWITPRLVYVKYFEKPPLLYWLTAISFKCFGFSSFAGSLPCVLGAFLALGSLGYLVARLRGPAVGAVAMMVLTTTLLFFVMTRLLTTDMLLTGWYSLSLVSLYFVFERGAWMTGEEKPALRARKDEGWLYVLAVASGLAVLTKGVIGLALPVATGVVYAVLRKRLLRLRWSTALGACLVWLVIVAPWFAVVSVRNPEFLHFFVVVQHVERFLGTSHEHVKPWWFFAPVTAAALLPWTPALFLGGRDRRVTKADGLSLFLWVWALVVVGFFSLSAGKLISYILPALPPLAGLIALNLAGEYDEEARRGLRYARWTGATFWVLAAAGVMIHVRRTTPPARLEVAPLAWVVAGVCLVAALAFVYWDQRRTAPHGFLAAAGATTLVWLTLASIAVPLEPELGLRTLCLKAKAQMRRGDVTVLYRQYCPGFVYYTRQRPILFEVKNELKFGMEHQPMGDWYREGDAAFVALMRGPRRVFCFTNDAAFAQATQLASPLYVISRAQKRVIFSNQPTDTVSRGESGS